MKRILLAAALVASMLTLSACGNDKTIDGKNYPTFGIANDGSHRDPNIQYEISAGSVVWAILLSETIVFPVYIIGWDLYQPVGPKIAK